MRKHGKLARERVALVEGLFAGIVERKKTVALAQPFVDYLNRFAKGVKVNGPK